MFPDFQKIREAAKRDGEAARMMAEDGVTPQIGEVYTVSRDFICNDGSWTDCFWTVLSKSGPNALVKITGRNENIVRLFAIDARAWYPAQEAFDVWQAEQNPAEETQ